MWGPGAAAAASRWRANRIQQRGLPTRTVEAGQARVVLLPSLWGGWGGTGQGQPNLERQAAPAASRAHGGDTEPEEAGLREGKATACQPSAAQTTVWQRQERLHETPSWGQGGVGGFWLDQDLGPSQGWQLGCHSRASANQLVVATWRI